MNATSSHIVGSNMLANVGLWERDILISRKNMAVFQLWIKRIFVASAVLNESMDDDEEPRRKRGKTRAWIRQGETRRFF